MDEVVRIVKELQRAVESLQRARSVSSLTFPEDGKLVIPVMTADPTLPANGQIWVNSTSSQLKVRIGGVTKVATLT